MAYEHLEMTQDQLLDRRVYLERLPQNEWCSSRKQDLIMHELGCIAFELAMRMHEQNQIEAVANGTAAERATD